MHASCSSGERFGPLSTVYQHFRDWQDDDTHDQVLEHLHIRLNRKGAVELDTKMIDPQRCEQPEALLAPEKGGQRSR
ncbi:hypothetical protein D3C84_1175870 [compost metagenome]